MHSPTMPVQRLILVASLSLLLSATSLAAETVSIGADKDAALIESPSGALANGSGPNFFVGRTAQDENSIRWALVRFDVAAALPRLAVIDRVELTLTMVP